VFTFPLAAAATACVIAILARRPKTILKPGILARVGVISYSLYLIHHPLLHYAQQLLLEQTRLVKFAGLSLALLPIYGLALLTYRYVELPSIEAGKWVISKFRPEPKLSPVT
jgi:peptidoglycan/LPS O-acetylase OafA/YrhL